MTLDPTDRRLVAALATGLPLVPRPFAALAADAGLAENAAIARTRRLLADGTLKRLGLIVRHHELGYRANAMAVWDVPDDECGAIARRLAVAPAVTLCYRRERRPGWPYNLYAMVHGRDRGQVRAAIARIAAACELDRFPHAILFSRRRFKQCGATYVARERT